MEKRLIVIFLMGALILNAQSKKQLRLHRENIAYSASNKTALVSLDTFFCSGVKYAVVRNSNASQENNKHCFMDLKTGDTLLLSSEMSEKIDSVKVYYFNCYFPRLHASCDVLRNAANNSIFDIICKNKLFNRNGLDTFNTETFITIKGNHKKKSELAENIRVNYKMVERDRIAQIQVVGNDIYQDSALIGSFEENTIDAPENKKFKQIRVYNAQKQIVCFSSEIDQKQHTWRLVTNMDGKYHVIKSAAVTDGDLFEILDFLIKQRYL